MRKPPQRAFPEIFESLISLREALNIHGDFKQHEPVKYYEMKDKVVEWIHELGKMMDHHYWYCD